MHKSFLYQKASLVLLLVFFSSCASPQKTVDQRLSGLSGFLGQFSVQDLTTHLVLTGLKESSGDSVPLVWDTGSDTSFREGDGKSSELFLGEKAYPFPFKKNILPDSFPGLLGNDFFQRTCLYWQGDTVLVFQSDSRFCTEPEAYLGIDFKKVLTTTQGEHFYVSLESESKQSCRGLVDTGASLSLFPENFFPTSESLGEKQVFLPGKKLIQAEERKTKSRLLIPVRDSEPLQYSGIRFLTGISIEGIDFPRDKGNKQVCVLGLDLLRKRPLFWDFSKKQIRIQESKDNGK